LKKLSRNLSRTKRKVKTLLLVRTIQKKIEKYSPKERESKKRSMYVSHTQVAMSALLPPPESVNNALLVDTGMLLELDPINTASTNHTSKEGRLRQYRQNRENKTAHWGNVRNKQAFEFSQCFR
jgi:hypothetical protein